MPGLGQQRQLEIIKTQTFGQGFIYSDPDAFLSHPEKWSTVNYFLRYEATEFSAYPYSAF